MIRENEKENRGNIGMYRNADFKVLSAIGMFLVLCGHYGSSFFSLDGVFEYDTFHIPMFIFISGYFFKEKNVQSINAVMSYIWKKVKHLLIPYYLWNVVYFIIAFFLQKYTSFQMMNGEITLNRLIITPLQLTDGAIYNVASWFLVALFLCQVAYVLLRFTLQSIFKEKSDVLMTLVMVVFCAIALNQCPKVDRLDWGITFCRTGYLVLYYHLGFLYKKYIEKLDNHINPCILCFFCIISKIILIFIWGNVIPTCYNMTFDVSVPGFYYVLCAVAGIYFWLNIAKIISPVVGEEKILNYYSDHTFSLMMHQGVAGIVINGILIYFFNMSEVMDAYHSLIWFNCLSGSQRVLLPIGISIMIVVCLKIYDEGRKSVLKIVSANRMN